MKLRINIDLAEIEQSAQSEIVANALVRYSQGILHLSMVPTGCVPLMAGPRCVGRAWIAEDEPVAVLIPLGGKIS